MRAGKQTALRTALLGAAGFALLMSSACQQDGPASKTSKTSKTSNANNANNLSTGNKTKDTPVVKKRPKRGIEGRKAPAWKVAKWFNLAEGAKPPEIADYAGKVVFLFFFQSW